MWRNLRLGLIGALSVFGCLSAASAFAAEVGASQTYHIDQGFLGHPVKLDVLEGDVRLEWGAGDVLFPSDLTVTKTSATSVSVLWSTSYALAPQGVKVGMKADMAGADATSSWTMLGVESKVPFGKWRSTTSTVKDGFVFARFGAEGDLRLASQPMGMRAGTATWYRYKKCRCAASPDFPKGTRILVRLVDRPEKFTVIRVNDYGPDRKLFPKRVIDLDSVAFKDVSPLSAGVIRVTIEPLDPQDPRGKLADVPAGKALPLPPTKAVAVK